MLLSQMIRLSIPTMSQGALNYYDLAGNICLGDIKSLVANKVYVPPLNPPSLFRIRAAVTGTPLGDISFAGYDYLAGLSAGLDSAQAIVLAAFTAGSPIPVPPDPASVNFIIQQAFKGSMTATKPDWTCNLANPVVTSMTNAFAQFIAGGYLA